MVRRSEGAAAAAVAGACVGGGGTGVYPDVALQAWVLGAEWGWTGCKRAGQCSLMPLRMHGQVRGQRRVWGEELTRPCSHPLHPSAHPSCSLAVRTTYASLPCLWWQLSKFLPNATKEQEAYKAQRTKTTMLYDMDAVAGAAGRSGPPTDPIAAALAAHGASRFH
jgi:hypothetical protein